MIASRGWKKLTDQPKPGVVSIVKELYANVKQTEGRIVRIRGKSVSYDKSTINDYFGVPDIYGDDEFTEYTKNNLDLDVVLQTLC